MSNYISSVISTEKYFPKFFSYQKSLFFSVNTCPHYLNRDKQEPTSLEETKQFHQD